MREGTRSATLLTEVDTLVRSKPSIQWFVLLLGVWLGLRRLLCIISFLPFVCIYYHSIVPTNNSSICFVCMHQIQIQIQIQFIQISVTSTTNGSVWKQPKVLSSPFLPASNTALRSTKTCTFRQCDCSLDRQPPTGRPCLDPKSTGTTRHATHMSMRFCAGSTPTRITTTTTARTTIATTTTKVTAREMRVMTVVASTVVVVGRLWCWPWLRAWHF